MRVHGSNTMLEELLNRLAGSERLTDWFPVDVILHLRPAGQVIAKPKHKNIKVKPSQKDGQDFVKLGLTSRINDLKYPKSNLWRYIS